MQVIAGQGITRLLLYYTAGGLLFFFLRCAFFLCLLRQLKYLCASAERARQIYREREREREINHESAQYVAVKLFNLCKYLHYKLPTRWADLQAAPLPYSLPTPPIFAASGLSYASAEVQLHRAAMHLTYKVQRAMRFCCVKQQTHPLETHAHTHTHWNTHIYEDVGRLQNQR